MKTSVLTATALRIGIIAVVLLAVGAELLVHPAKASLLQEKRAELAEVESRIQTTQQEIERATAELARLESEIASMTAAVAAARTAELETKLELATKRQELGLRLIAYYKEKRTSIPVIVQLLFNDGDLQDLITIAPHLVRIAEEDRSLVDEVSALARGLLLKQQELARERSALARSHEALGHTRLELAQLLEQARSEEKVLAAEVDVLEAADALVRKAQDRRAAYRGRVSRETWALAQGFTFPVAGRYAFSNDWGNPRPDDRTHKGTDIMAPHGTPVIACVEGRIDRIDYGQPLGGTIIWLRGDNGHKYYYAHLSAVEPGIQTGQRILPGFVIGRVGTTGNANGGVPHLHFQMHPGGGAAVNPYPALAISG